MCLDEGTVVSMCPDREWVSLAGQGNVGVRC